MPLAQASENKHCRDYPTMQSHQIFKHGVKRHNVDFIGTPVDWLSHFEPDKDLRLAEIFNRQNKSIEDYENLLICGVNSLKRFTTASIFRLGSMIRGSLFQIDDSNFNQDKGFITLAHYIKKNHSSEHSIDLGLAVDTETFRPGDKNLSGQLIVHVDHRWTKTARLDGFDTIKSIISEMKSIIDQDDRWNSIKVVYHTEEISDISTLGEYDPKNTSMEDLAAIYSKTHLAFVSHAETLGQYPLEMLSSGASVVMHRKFIPKETRNLYGFLDITEFDPKKFLREVNSEEFSANRSQAEKFSYSIWVDKMLDRIIK